MSVPKTKRQFAGAASDPAQRQITAFFDKTSSSSSSPSNGNAPTVAKAALNGPALPAQVQANLLSVGMRVRKSVPEGYKTGTAYSGFSLWSDSDTSSNRNNNLSPTTGGSGASRELTPFCGIHKVGGLAVQQSQTTTDSYDNAVAFKFTSADDDDDLVPMLDDVPSLTSSQESAVSRTSNSSATLSAMRATSSAAMNRKRFYVTEEEEQQQQQQDVFSAGCRGDEAAVGGGKNISWRNRADWLEAEISPRSFAPVGWGENARVMAMPKRRSVADRKPSLPTPVAAAPVVSVADVDQENMAVDDFEEATFLDYRMESGDMDLE
ncbi:ribonucleotide reductase inhibitor-domain-containing protein [Apodospora peruviana]|uniref:Ribonucleotide reductase inhibitor-domain-containing protein n=1 Tax=Apodospora peruviana TaxID=516989 RepID=A0AAE0ISP7_9PEZI|nr:ribonucleotide reductase inhibitor-domain-containing protein [Apodospora peruviana]